MDWDVRASFVIEWGYRHGNGNGNGCMYLLVYRYEVAERERTWFDSCTLDYVCCELGLQPVPA